MCTCFEYLVNSLFYIGTFTVIDLLSHIRHLEAQESRCYYGNRRPTPFLGLRSLLALISVSANCMTDDSSKPNWNFHLLHHLNFISISEQLIIILRLNNGSRTSSADGTSRIRIAVPAG